MVCCKFAEEIISIVSRRCIFGFAEFWILLKIDEPEMNGTELKSIGLYFQIFLSQCLFNVFSIFGYYLFETGSYFGVCA